MSTNQYRSHPGEFEPVNFAIRHSPLGFIIDEAQHAWRDEANCKGINPDTFFGGAGFSAKAAREICQACDVQVECLDYSVETNEEFGIWGGTSVRERRRIRRQQLQDSQEDEPAA